MSMETVPLLSGLFREPKDIMTKLRILLLATTALTATQFATSASHAQTAPIVVAQAKEEGGPPGARKEAPRALRRRLPRRGRRLLRHLRRLHLARPAALRRRRPLRLRHRDRAPHPPPPAARAAASGATSAATGAPRRRHRHLRRRPPLPRRRPRQHLRRLRRLHLRVRRRAASSAGSRACGAEATGRTDAATAAAFIPEGDAIPRAAAPPPAGARAAACTCHHADSNSAADGRPSTRWKHDGATAACRRTDDASECGRSDDHDAAGTTRRAAACRAGAELPHRHRAPRRPPLHPPLREERAPRRQPPCRARPTPRRLPAGRKTHRRRLRRPSARHLKSPHRCQQRRRRKPEIKAIAPGTRPSGPQRVWTTSAASAARASRAAAPSSPSPAGSSFAIPADSGMSVTAR